MPSSLRAALTFALGALLGLSAAGCLSEGAGPEGGEGEGGQGGQGGQGGGAIEPHDFCPRADEPRVHYLSEDPNACLGVSLECDEGQTGFQNSCGCGCIDKGPALCPAPFDPAITWHDTDPARCPAEPPDCPLGQHGFSNECGCGCTAPGA